MQSEEHLAFLRSPAFKELCDTCIADEKSGGFDDAVFLNNPLIDAPIFSSFPAWSGSLRSVYEGGFSDLIYGEKPSISEIGASLKMIKTAL